MAFITNFGRNSNTSERNIYSQHVNLTFKLQGFTYFSLLSCRLNSEHGVHHNKCNSRPESNKSALTVIAPSILPSVLISSVLSFPHFIPLPTTSSLFYLYQHPPYYKKPSSCFKRKVWTINVRKHKYALIT